MNATNDQPGAFEAQLRAWGAELDKLKAKVDKDVAEAKREYYERVEHLQREIEAELLKWGYEVEELQSKAKPEFRKAFEQLRSGIQAEVKRWTPEIEALKASAAEAEVEAKKLLETLRARRKGLADDLSELRGAGEAAWGDVKTGIGRAWDELKVALRQASEKFK